METLPIAELSPELPGLETKQARAIVTLIWPFSSSSRTCALLLAEPDFRLRSKRGQVRVRFTSSSAKAVAGTGIGIGDEVVLGLRGAKFVEKEAAVSTPGKSIEWELSYSQTLVVQIFRDGKEIAALDIVDAAPTPAPGSPVRRQPLETPLKRVSLAPASVQRWTSPAFLKRSRLSGDALLAPAYDPLRLDDDAEPSKKKRRKSYRDWTVWKYSARTPSPEKEDLDTDVDVDDMDMDVSPTRPAHLPATPTSPTKHVSSVDAQPALNRATTDEGHGQEADPRPLSHSEDTPVEDAAQSQEAQHTAKDMRDADYDDLYAGPDETPAGDLRYINGGDTQLNTQFREDSQDRYTADKAEREKSPPPVSSPLQQEAQVVSLPEWSSSPVIPKLDEARHDHGRESPEPQQVQGEVAEPPRVAMPPPTLPSLQTSFQSVSSNDLLTPIGQQPRSPVIKPLDSSTLPMPSPFPGEREGNNSMSYFERPTALQSLDQSQDESQQGKNTTKEPSSEADSIVESSFYSSGDYGSFGWGQASHESAYTDVRFTFGLDTSTLSQNNDIAKPAEPEQKGEEPSVTESAGPADVQELCEVVAEEIIEEVAEEVADEVMEDLQSDFPEASQAVRAELVEVLAGEFEEDIPGEFQQEIEEEAQKESRSLDEGDNAKSPDKRFTDEDENEDAAAGTDVQNVDHTTHEETHTVTEFPPEPDAIMILSDTEESGMGVEHRFESHDIEKQSKPATVGEPIAESAANNTAEMVDEDTSHTDTLRDLPQVEPAAQPRENLEPIVQQRPKPVAEIIDLGSPSASDSDETEDEDVVDDRADDLVPYSEFVARQASHVERSTTPSHVIPENLAHTNSNQENDISAREAVRVDSMDYNPPTMVGADMDHAMLDMHSTQDTATETQRTQDTHPDVKLETIEDDFSYQMSSFPAHDDDAGSVSSSAEETLLIAVPEAGHGMGELQFKSVAASAPARNTRSKTRQSMTSLKDDSPASHQGTRPRRSKASIASATPALESMEKRSESTTSSAQTDNARSSRTKPLPVTSRRSLTRGRMAMDDFSPSQSTQDFSQQEKSQVESNELPQSFYQPSQELGSWQYQPSQELGTFQSQFPGKYENVFSIKDSEEGSSHSEHSLSTVPFSDDDGYVPMYMDYSDGMESLVHARESADVQSTVPLSPQHIVTDSQKPTHGVYEFPSDSVEEGEKGGSAEATPKATFNDIGYPQLAVEASEREAAPVPSSPPQGDRSPPPLPDKISSSVTQPSLMNSHRPPTPDATQHTLTESQPSVVRMEQSLPLTPQLTQSMSAGLASVGPSIEINVKMEEVPYQPLVVPSTRSISPQLVVDYNSRPRTSSVHSEDLSDSDEETETQLAASLDPPSIGLSTPMSYYTPLKDLDYFLNRASSFHTGTNPDILALVTSATTPAKRATKGPKHYTTTLQITDLSIFPAKTSVNVFRPFTSALPVADVGDVILLRSFHVRSLNRKCMLLSGDESAWCVWRWGKPVWGVKKSLVCAEVRAREEIKGPAVEMGEVEWREVERLRGWWVNKVRGEMEKKEEAVEESAENGKEKDAPKTPTKKGKGKALATTPLRTSPRWKTPEATTQDAAEDVADNGREKAAPKTPSRKGKEKPAVATPLWTSPRRQAPLRTSPRKKKDDQNGGHGGQSRL